MQTYNNTLYWDTNKARFISINQGTNSNLKLFVIQAIGVVQDSLASSACASHIVHVSQPGSLS